MNDPENAAHRFATRAVHAGQPPDPLTGALMVPIYQNSTYRQRAPAEPIDGYEYARTKNPTRLALERNLASLEGGKHGLCFSSGLAATNNVMNLLKSGDHVVAGDDLYGGTWRLFERLYANFGVKFTYVDFCDLDAVKRALRPETKYVFTETPTNPLLKICDLAAIAKLAHAAGAKAVCDNTFATPYLQRPLEAGFDVVLHSVTKYLGGHSDVIGGALIVDDDELAQRLAFFQNAVGSVPGPNDCFLVLRGTKTLHLRMDRHCATALRLAQFLAKHPEVTKVHYPGLPGHPGHALAKRQMSQFGGMISFVVKGDVARGKRVAGATKLFACAESLGGVESLIEHPPSMTHASIPAELRRARGLDDGLLRLSVGVEDPDDLEADLKQALEAK
jgi:cystathionine beta-lyase/cystathionine gamma-synthase